MLGQRQRRWPNINPALGQHPVLAGKHLRRNDKVPLSDLKGLIQSPSIVHMIDIHMFICFDCTCKMMTFVFPQAHAPLQSIYGISVRERSLERQLEVKD